MDGVKLAANLRGGVWLHVEGIVMRQAARQVNHDDRLVRAPALGLLGLQKTGQTEAAHRKAADFEKGAALHAVAIALRASEKIQHDIFPLIETGGKAGWDKSSNRP